MATRVETLEFVGLFGQLIARARGSLRKLQLLHDERTTTTDDGGGGGGRRSRAAAEGREEDDELTSLRVRSQKHEVLITLDKHHVFFVVQGQTEVDGDDDDDAEES